MSAYAIETVGLTKKYGEQFGVNNLSLSVPHGKIYCGLFILGTHLGE